jgi:hypothetical protein
MRANEIFEMTMLHCGQLAPELERYSFQSIGLQDWVSGLGLEGRATVS